MIHRLFYCKINQWVILCVWDSLVSVGTKKSPSAVNPLCSIKSMTPLLWDICEQVDQIFCLHFLHRWLMWFNFVYLTHSQKNITLNWDCSMLTMKGPLSLFRASSFASHFWVNLHHLSALNLEHGTKLPLVLQILVLECLTFYKYRCLFCWKKQCCLCPVFMPKWGSWEKCYIKCLSNQGITEENCQLVWALLLWNFFRMASSLMQADVVTTPVLGHIDKSTVFMCCWLLSFLLCLQKNFSIFLPPRFFLLLSQC